MEGAICVQGQSPWSGSHFDWVFYGTQNSQLYVTLNFFTCHFVELSQESTDKVPKS